MTGRKTIFITGANRGIGLGLTGVFLAGGHNVLAAARNPDGARELWELERDFKGRCRIVGLDVTDDADLDRLERDFAGQPIDVLINNAGILVDTGGGLMELSAEQVLKSLAVNTLAPLRVTQRLLPNLTAAVDPVVAFMSSRMGSIGDNKQGGSYAYRISKAALNMLVKTIAVECGELTAVTLHPGWVKTDMGGSAAPTEIDESTNGLAKVILGLTRRDSGHFLDYRGKEIPW